ncbi:collagen-like triple helix repeat-containing protein [Maribacter thermophilus]|uniref:collagen-like triple helix repeat-containing protein n=1 Tax=Maribacter thermophilus TaxID=1197874 RepID=UPI000B244233|nr:collagen-like protein [Maribacter thermophilus]
MKTFKFTKQLLSLLFISSMLIACSKEDGEDGAIGPQGPQGEQGIPGEDGADGADGEQGEKGDTGTANVIYSGWITSGFEANILDDSATFDIEAPSLTQEIIDEGAVLVYGRTTGIDSDVLPLPIYIPTTHESYYHRLEGVGQIQIRVVTDDSSLIGSTLFSDYRYILIPGGVEASNGIGGITGKSSTDYSNMSYEEIVAQFNIPE